MATVAQLVEDVAEIFGESHRTVNAYARALINAGLLPKARGRAVPEVEGEHVVRLIAAVALEPKQNETGEVVEHYMGLTQDVIDAINVEGAPDEIKKVAELTVEEFLLVLLWSLFGPKSEANEIAQTMKIEFVRNWPEVAFAMKEDGQPRVNRHRDSSLVPGYWAKHIRRVTEVSAETFVWLGHRNGRDYSEVFYRG